MTPLPLPNVSFSTDETVEEVIEGYNITMSETTPRGFPFLPKVGFINMQSGQKHVECAETSVLVNVMAEILNRQKN